MSCQILVASVVVALLGMVRMNLALTEVGVRLVMVGEMAFDQARAWASISETPSWFCSKRGIKSGILLSGLMTALTTSWGSSFCEYWI